MCLKTSFTTWNNFYHCLFPISMLLCWAKWSPAEVRNHTNQPPKPCSLLTFSSKQEKEQALPNVAYLHQVKNWMYIILAVAHFLAWVHSRSVRKLCKIPVRWSEQSLKCVLSYLCLSVLLLSVPSKIYYPNFSNCGTVSIHLVDPTSQQVFK